MQIINSALLDTVSGKAKSAPRLRMNHNFHPTDESACHRLLNAIEPGSYIRPHRHLAAGKDENFIVLRGSLGILVFDDHGAIVETAVIGAGMDAVGCDLPGGTFHTAVALETGTVFYESKAGPYRPLTDDEKAPWAPADNEPEAADYMKNLVAAVQG